MSKLKLGDQVAIKARLIREGLGWERHELGMPIICTIVGKRTLWDSSWEQEDYGPRYLNHFAYPHPAYIVAPNLTRFYHVDEEDIHLL